MIARKKIVGSLNNFLFLFSFVVSCECYDRESHMHIASGVTYQRCSANSWSMYKVYLHLSIDNRSVSHNKNTRLLTYFMCSVDYNPNCINYVICSNQHWLNNVARTGITHDATPPSAWSAKSSHFSLER